MTQKLFSWLLHKLHIIHQNIHFTMETKRDKHCPSLHTDIYRRPVAYPGILFRGGSTNSVEDRERGDLGVVAP